MHTHVVSWPNRTKNFELTLPDNPVYRFLKLTGIQIAFLLRCIYVRKFLCLMEFGIPSFFKVRSVTPVEVLNPMQSECYSRCTRTVLRTWVCIVQYGNIGLEVSYLGSQISSDFRVDTWSLPMALHTDGGRGHSLKSLFYK